MSIALIAFWLVYLSHWLAVAFAYIPALPTNSTVAGVQGAPNTTDVSQLTVQWYYNGSYSDNISYELAGMESNGTTRGALVHFSEESVDENTPPTTTPWIAMVACDANATKFSLEIDIFTLARDKGAKAALLYSIYSKACLINAEYLDPTFDKVFDIFSTQSLTSAQFIEEQFRNANGTFRWYDSQNLNNSGEIVNATIKARTPTEPNYLLATLRAYNATGEDDAASPTSSSTGAASDPGSSSNTSLAMIILYAITGCVSALFCVVIISGAVRAIRHPERYGPRSGRFGGAYSQSRVRGLTRAMLDTFPVVKFGSSQGTGTDREGGSGAGKDVEASFANAPPGEGNIPTEIKLADLSREPKQSSIVALGGQTSSNPASLNVEGEQVASDVVAVVPRRASDSSGRTSDAEPSARPNSAPAAASASSAPVRRPSQRTIVEPESMGRETCPICIVDFEEGDDLRVLPCEGNHRFHQQCVDPWLLELSSSCPICRQDFLALETILSGESEETSARNQSPDHHHTHNESPTNGRFSRYLRFARRRRPEPEEEEDPTDPYLPMAAHTSLYHPTS
ncbi:hypothetical protein BDN71DRAFT_1501208 [Pleurotus eryngii]|uniref:RING-type domain-containing protein n=1 Tax=Pleurotus eryngii TaxID=5323 RepID=A0A9P6AAQ2_PLEER|nr:hypothetical protein BDN71DRAFT_1501208 [Pleurotus eryngii]